ncbi:MAG: hypothetical protein LUG99_00535 [Lachnospiraceae bacterium]|nr:hypothetical protein [Lachnospiraceae bacterium]
MSKLPTLAHLKESATRAIALIGEVATAASEAIDEVVNTNVYEALQIAAEHTRLIMSLQTNLDNTQDDLSSTQEELDSTKEDLANLTESHETLSDSVDNLDTEMYEMQELSAEHTRQIMSARDGLEAITGEVLEVTLTNTQSYPFNDSQTTVQLSTTRSTKNYTILAEIESMTGGAVGDVEYSDKLLNGFKVAYTGSATSVTLKLYVQGGMQ